MKSRKLHYGEKVFVSAFTAVSLILLARSVQLWRKSPGWSGMAALPLVISGAMTAASVWMLLETFRCPSCCEKGNSMLLALTETARYLFPGKLSVFAVYVLLYGVFLKPLGFGLCTFLFLWAAMLTLYPEKNRKAIAGFFLISAAVLAAITFLFQYVFRVVLP